MKKLFILLLFVSSSLFAQGEFMDGYREGWKAGYCNAQPGCYAPYAPYKSHKMGATYQEGYDIGRDDGKAKRAEKDGKDSSKNESDPYGDLYKSLDDAAQARRQAAIEKAAAMSPPSKEIKTPVNVDLNNYTTIALVDVVDSWGFRSRGVYRQIASELMSSPLSVKNPLEVDKKRFKKNRQFLKEEKNSDWLYLFYKVTEVGVDEVRSIIVRDSKNKVIYSATHTNMPPSEVLYPIIAF